MILSDFCLKNMALVLRGGGAPESYKKEFADKMETYGFGCKEALEYAKERYKYYSNEARIKLRENGLKWMNVDESG